MGKSIFREQLQQIHAFQQQLEREVWSPSRGINAGVGSGGIVLN